MANKKYLEVLKFRIYPTKVQKNILDNEIKFYLRYRTALFREIKNKQCESLLKISESELSEICDNFAKRINKTKFDHMKYFYSNHFDYAKENVIKALTYKKKENIKRYDTDRVTIKISDPSCYIMCGYFYFKNIYKIKIKPKVDLLESVSFINLTRTNGKYYISVARFLDVIKVPKSYKACGIDIGFKTYMTVYDSDDEISKVVFENFTIDRLISKANFYKRTLSHIESVNSDYKKSKNYKKILIKLENTYERISNIRSYFFNDIATKLVLKYDVITIEHLEFEDLYKKRESKLNLQKYSFGSFFKVLEEKAKKYNKRVIRADRFFMSSQICSECGVINHEMKNYYKRDFECECGFKIDRDVNAAKNLLYYGLRYIRKNNSLSKNITYEKFNEVTK